MVAFGLWATGAGARAGGDPDRPAPRRLGGLVHRSRRVGGDAGTACDVGADAGTACRCDGDRRLSRVPRRRRRLRRPAGSCGAAASARAAVAWRGPGAGARASAGRAADAHAGRPSDSTWRRPHRHPCLPPVGRPRAGGPRRRSARVHADAEPGRGRAAATAKYRRRTPSRPPSTRAHRRSPPSSRPPPTQPPAAPPSSQRPAEPMPEPPRPASSLLSARTAATAEQWARTQPGPDGASPGIPCSRPS